MTAPSPLPNILTRAVTVLVPGDLGAAILGDLMERYHEQAAHTPLSARLWLWRQVFASVPHLAALGLGISLWRLALILAVGLLSPLMFAWVDAALVGPSAWRLSMEGGLSDFSPRWMYLWFSAVSALCFGGVLRFGLGLLVPYSRAGLGCAVCIAVILSLPVAVRLMQSTDLSLFIFRVVQGGAVFAAAGFAAHWGRHLTFRSRV